MEEETKVEEIEETKAEEALVEENLDTPVE